VAIYSTTNGPAAEFLLESVRRNFWRQLTWAGISATAIVIALMLPVRFFQKVSYPVYILTLLLLVAALLFGREINGAKSWLEIGPIQLQVSEFAKVGTVLAVAQLLSSRRPNENYIRYALAAVGLLIVPGTLILLQNDTGTALVFFALVPIMLFWSGLPISAVMLMISPAITGYLAIVYMPAAIAFAVIFTVIMFIRSKERRYAVLAGVFTGGTIGAVTFAL